MRDPALLEYAGRDLFKVRIFPIEPRSRKPIKISYTECCVRIRAQLPTVSAKHREVLRSTDQEVSVSRSN